MKKKIEKFFADMWSQFVKQAEIEAKLGIIR